MGIRPQAWLVIALRPPREVIFFVIDLPEGIGIPALYSEPSQSRSSLLKPGISVGCRFFCVSGLHASSQPPQRINSRFYYVPSGGGRPAD